MKRKSHKLLTEFSANSNENLRNQWCRNDADITRENRLRQGNEELMTILNKCMWSVSSNPVYITT